MTRIILITGAPGIGKTSVAQLLAQRLRGSVARLCGDVFILAVTPFEISEDRRLFLRRNLASFAKHSIKHGYDWVVIECVIPSDRFIDDLTGAVGVDDDHFTIVSLLADRRVYEQRLQTKLQHHDTSGVNFETYHEWMDRIRRLAVPSPIDTSTRSAEETAAEVLRLISEGDTH